MGSKYRHECPDGCKIFVGNLDRELTRDRLKTIFSDYGKVRDIWLATNPPGFGFVMYERRSDAKLAVRQMNNQRISGRFLTVELATGLKRTNGCGDVKRDDRRVPKESDRSPRQQKYGRYDRWGDRCFYSSEFKPTLSPKTKDRRQRRQECEVSGSSGCRRTRSPIDKRDDKRKDEYRTRQK